MGEPCMFCQSPATGPAERTPHGICPPCACSQCRGFRQYDDRGFLCTGQPFLTASPCPACKGAGTRPAQAPSPAAVHIPKGDD